MKTVSRNLYVKRIKYSAKKNKTSDALPTLDEMVRGIFAKTHTVGDRHYPAPTKLVAGKECVCLDDFYDKPGPGVLFTVYNYIHSHIPDQFVPDLNAKHVTVLAEPLTTTDGKLKAVATSFQVLVLGETMIIEYVSGSGGISTVLRALRYLAQKRVDKRLANFRPTNIPSRKLAEMIKLRKGVKAVRATLNGVSTSDGARFSSTLSSALKSFTHAAKLTVQWLAGDKQDTFEDEEVLRFWDEIDPESGLTSAQITFGDGTSQDNIDDYVEKREVTVQAVRDGIPTATEIAAELRKYMTDLMSAQDGRRIIGTDGFLLPIS